MFKTITLSIFSFITAFLLIETSFAQSVIPTTYLQQTDTAWTSSSCLTLTTNLSYKNRKSNNKDDVTSLQNFLYTYKYLSYNSITGFFGKTTEKAVTIFQKDNKLHSTPLGFVGPGTRSLIKRMSCNQPVTLTPTPENSTIISSNVCAPGDIFNKNTGSLCLKTPTIVCTMEMVQCPDGSYSGRSGSRCEADCSKQLVSIAPTKPLKLTTSAGETTPLKQKRMVAYYPYWSTYKGDKIPYQSLTHIMHAFIQVSSNATFDITSNTSVLEPDMISKAHAKNVKVFASIGGAGLLEKQNFIAISTSPTLRTAFANNLTTFLLANNYDGVDFDWEFPETDTQRINQNLLVEEVRKTFNARVPSFGISMAIAPNDWYGKWSDYTTLNNYVDFYNIMTYEFSGSQDTLAGHNSPLYKGNNTQETTNVASAFSYLTSTRGIPVSKLNLGIPFYGKKYPNTETIYNSPTTDTTTLNYNEILPMIGSGWTENYDSTSKVPYLTKDTGTGLITYENQLSVREKVNYAFTNNFGGVFIWDLTGDYINGSQPLLEAMVNASLTWGFLPITTTPVTTTTTNTQETCSQWGSTRIYLKDDCVIYNGTTYTAKWWTQGNVPNNDQWAVWTPKTTVATATTPTQVTNTQETCSQWGSTRIYLKDDCVIYNGTTYTAKWWTQGNVPNNDQWAVWTPKTTVENQNNNIIVTATSSPISNENQNIATNEKNSTLNERRRTLATLINKPKNLLIGLGSESIEDIQSQGISPDIYDRYFVGIGQNSWINWNSPTGEYVQIVANNAEKMNSVPMLTVYQMAARGDGDLSGLKDEGFMKDYWDNIRILLTKIQKYNKPVLVNIEPDFFGYAQRLSPDPTKMLVQNTTVNKDCPTVTNDVVGFTSCFISMARSYAPKAYIGFPPSGFSDLSVTQSDYMKKIGAGNADFLVMTSLDRDIGCMEAKYIEAGCNRMSAPQDLTYWDETNTKSPNFKEYFSGIESYSKVFQLPVILWQTPMGVPSNNPGGTAGHWRDNRLRYFFSHTNELINAGIFAVVFSAGHDSQTTINTDGGQFKREFSEYLKKPTALP